jgi:hypothetical protein
MYDVPKELHAFRNFLRIIWQHLNLPDPTPVQLDIADYLQYGPSRKVIEGFRGVGKSWITSAYVCWSLLLDPQKNFLVVSASKARADDFSTFTLRLIADVPILKHLYPDDNQRCSKVAFDVRPAEADHAPSVKSVGIWGQLTGSRADEIIADDVEVPNTSATQMMREKLSEAVKEFEAIIKPGGKITFLGTPQTEESLYNRLPERGYAIRVWPARLPSRAAMAHYGDRLAPFVVNLIEKGGREGAPTDPKRFSETDLLAREASFGRSGFALQFMLDTRMADADRYPLKLRDLVVMDLNPDMAPARVIWASGDQQVIQGLPNVGFSGDRFHAPMEFARNPDTGAIIMRPYEGKVMAIDPAGRGRDELAYAIVGQLNGQLFLLDCAGFRGVGYDDTVLSAIAEAAKRYKVDKVIIEPNYGGGMFAQLLKPVLARVYPCTIEDAAWSRAQKERRIIDTLEPVMNQHRLIVDKSLVKRDFESVLELPPEEAVSYRLFYQMTRITKDRGALIRDDRIDALAMAVAHWEALIGIEIERKMAADREAALDAELRKFMDTVFSGAARSDRYRETTWMSWCLD